MIVTHHLIRADSESTTWVSDKKTKDSQQYSANSRPGSRSGLFTRNQEDQQNQQYYWSILANGRYNGVYVSISKNKCQDV